MYKVEFKTKSDQKGAIYIIAKSDYDASAKVKTYFKRLGEIVEISLISFQRTDMFIEIKQST